MIDKELLLKSRLYEEDYDIPGVGTVRFRRLSWQECADFQKWTEQGKAVAEVYARVLALALVDPELTVEEATAWLSTATGGEIEDISMHILRTSGLVEGAQKSTGEGARSR